MTYLLVTSVLLWLCSCTLGQGHYREGFFNGSSYVNIYSPLALTRHIGLSFRTCRGGQLFSQSPRSSLIHMISLDVRTEGLVFTVITNKQKYESKMNLNLLDNEWHTVNILYRMGNLTISTSGHQLVIANSTYNAEILTELSSGNDIVTVGKGFVGCILEGPSIVFNSQAQASEVEWGPCPLPNRACEMFDHCANEPCMRHGRCIRLPDRHLCQCTPRYSGSNCQYDNGPPCDNFPCKNNGKCYEDPTGDYTCHCATGFAGRTCELEARLTQICENNFPCLNNATCRLTGGNTYICECKPGFEGKVCETNINECLSSPCQHGGTCIDGVNEFKCVCGNSGYTGTLCETNINECDDNPCLNNGICFDNYGGYTCQCASGFGGQNCELKLSECASNPCNFPNSVCVESNLSYQCVCRNGYVGIPPNCTRSGEVCANGNPCLNGGTCIPSGDSWACICHPAYTGDSCEETLDWCDPCDNGGTYMMSAGGFFCLCHSGYTGPRCSIPISCDAFPCLHVAACLDFPGGYFCACENGWKGHNCDEFSSNCNAETCTNGGTCIYTVDGPYCSCPIPFTGSLCETSLVDDCASSPCQNGGACMNTNSGYQCTCPPEFSGPNCELSDPCAQHPCQNNGTCQSIQGHNGVRSYYCECENTGFEGIHCENNINDCLNEHCPEGKVCVDGVNSFKCQDPLRKPKCSPSLCQNGGTCSEETNKTCACPPGFKGEFCESDINECDTPRLCVNGICRNTEGSYQCFCTPGFAGDHCEIDFDECLSHPCFNGASCVNKVNGFDCICTPGYTGKNCSININECESNPCLSGAECVDEIATFTCICPPGLTGRLCEQNIDDCVSNPCQNKGVCIDLLNRYSCNCTDTGFEGEHCEVNIDECLSNPCQNGATCVDDIKSYSCNCHPGYTGINCETDIDECESNPCKNGGTCKERSSDSSAFPEGFDYSKAAGYECICPLGIVGINCEKDINECESSPCKHGSCSDLINGYSCDCDDGYEGDHCDIEINECQKYKPCIHGTCNDRIANYVCECDSRYGGKNCSVELTGCINNQCLHGGTCTPYLVDETQHLFNCSCPHGFQGPTCEKITTMFYDGDSYGIVTTNREEGYDIRLRFKTTLPDGLLALGKGSTYYILELSNGRLNLHSSLLNKWEGVFIGSGLNDSNWQQIFVTINSTHLVLAANQEQTIYPITYLNEGVNVSHTSFSTTYIGGAMSYLRKLPHGPSTFRGCVEDVMINGQWVVLPVPPNSTSISLKGVQLGCQREPQCSPNPCHSGGHCTDLWNNFSCSCERPYLGNTCQYNYTAATFGHENITDSVVTVTVDPASRRAVRTIMDISMFIRTREPSGGIFYLGSKPGSTPKSEETIIAARLSGGELQVTIQFNATPESYSVAGVRIDTGYNQLIQVIRNVTLIQIKINGTEFFRKTITVTGQLDLQILQLGSTKPLHDEEPNFKGIIQDVQMSNGTRTMVVEFFPLPPAEDFESPLSLGQVDIDESRVLREIVSDDNCRLSPCMHNGICTVTWNDFNCECPIGFKGKQCQEMEFCQMQDCPAGSECRNLNEGYECVANITLHNPNPDTPGLKYRLVRGRREEGDIEMTDLSVSYRSRTGGNLLFIGPDAQHNYLSISVYQDQVYFDWNLGHGPSHSKIAKETRDGDWTTIWIKVQENSMTGGLSGTSDEVKPSYLNANTSIEAWHSLLTTSNISIGGTSDVHGIDRQSYISVAAADQTNSLDTVHPSDMSAVDPSLSLFQGCIGEVRISGLLLSYFTAEELNATNTSERNHFELITGSSLGQDLGCMLCFEEECQNGGMCENSTESYICKCLQGFEGDDCAQDIDECRENDCKNNSTCVDGLAKYTCECLPGWEGPLCDNDIDECASSPCQHNGTCKDELARFVCICPPEYVGDVCDQLKQITCDSKPCHNGAECTDLFNPKTNDNFTCSCQEGFLGSYCDSAFCEVEPCKNSGQCIRTSLKPFCECPLGFTGKLCETNIDDCASGPCAHQGKCIDGIATFLCDCQGTGYTGPYCTIDIDECVTRLADCGQFGKCQNTEGSFVCNCDLGFCGVGCNMSDPCLPVSPCENGAQCVPNCIDKSDYKCLCTTDFKGKNCTEPSGPVFAGTNVTDIALVVVPILGILLIAGLVSLVIFVMMARKKRATRGTYSPSSQEFSNPRLELDNVMKPPPEERLI